MLSIAEPERLRRIFMTIGAAHLLLVGQLVLQPSHASATGLSVQLVSPKNATEVSGTITLSAVVLSDVAPTVRFLASGRSVADATCTRENEEWRCRAQWDTSREQLGSKPSVTAVATTSGASATSNAVTVTILNQSAVTVVSPKDGEFVETGYARATAGRVAGTTNAATVAWYTNGVYIGDGNPTYEWSAHIPVCGGTQYVTATAIDGNSWFETSSAPRRFVGQSSGCGNLQDAMAITNRAEFGSAVLPGKAVRFTGGTDTVCYLTRDGMTYRNDPCSGSWSIPQVPAGTYRLAIRSNPNYLRASQRLIVHVADAGAPATSSPTAGSTPAAPASPQPSSSPTAAPSSGPSTYSATARILSPTGGSRTTPDVQVSFDASGSYGHVYCRFTSPTGEVTVVNPCTSPHRLRLQLGSWLLAVRAVASTGEAAPEHEVAITVTDGTASPSPSQQPASPSASPSPHAASPTSSPPSAATEVPRVTVAPYVVKFGQTASATISGTPGGTVDLYIRKNGGSFTPIRYAVQLDGSGRATVPTRPDMNLRFMARDRATQATSAVGGADGLVTVEKYVSINISRVGQNRYTFSGSINPRHPGAVVHLYRNGQLIRSSIPVNSSRVYSWTGSLPGGAASYRITSPVTGYNNLSHSPTRSVVIS